MKKMISKITHNNNFMKPLSVLLTMTAPMIFLMNESFSAVALEGTDLVAISKESLSGITGALLVIIASLSISYVYKPPKILMFSIIVGGMMLFASAVFAMVGSVLLLFGLSMVANNVLLQPTINRNDMLKQKKLEIEIQQYVSGGKK